MAREPVAISQKRAGEALLAHPAPLFPAASASLAEPICHDAFDGFDRLVAVGASGGDLELDALDCTEHHHLHDGFAVDDFLGAVAAVDSDVRLELGGGVNEHHRGARVQAQAVDDRHNGRAFAWQDASPRAASKPVADP